MRNKIITIALFEFSEKIKTRAFLIYMIVFPMVVIASSLLPAYLAGSAEKSTAVIGMLDETGGYYSSGISNALSRVIMNNGQPEYLSVVIKNGAVSDHLIAQADSLVNKGCILGYLIINDSSVSYKSRHEAAPGQIAEFEKAYNKLRTLRLLNSRGIAGPDVENAISDVVIKKIKSDIAENPDALLLSSLFFVVLLFMTIMFSGGLLVRSIIEEKSNRIMEIILSSCTPQQLLSGKVIGLAALGLFQVLIWTLIGFFLFVQGLLPAATFSGAGLSVLYFTLGYVLYTSIFVGAGSVVNTEQEAQHFSGYLSLLLIMPLVLAIKVAEAPDSLPVIFLSYFPLTSPAIMMIRMKFTSIPISEIIITSLLLVSSIIGIIRISSAVFAASALRYDRWTFRKLFGNLFRKNNSVNE